jgi:hypothetical protein
MRVLRLDGSEASKRAFVHLFVALRSRPVEGIDQIRLVGKLMDKLEAIGETVGVGADTGWQLRDSGGELWLEGPQYAELRARMQAHKWPAETARYVAATFDLIDNAPEQEPGQSKPAKPIELVEPEPESSAAAAEA